MRLPLQISFRNCPQSAAVVQAVEKRADQLDRYFPRIMGCRVTVEIPHRHHHKGRLYRIAIDMTLPGNEIVVGRVPTAHKAHEDVFVAIRESFDAARRRLQDCARLRRRPRGDLRRPFLTSGEQVQ